MLLIILSLILAQSLVAGQTFCTPPNQPAPTTEPICGDQPAVNGQCPYYCADQTYILSGSTCYQPCPEGLATDTPGLCQKVVSTPSTTSSAPAPAATSKSTTKSGLRPGSILKKYTRSIYLAAYLCKKFNPLGCEWIPSLKCYLPKCKKGFKPVGKECVPTTPTTPTPPTPPTPVASCPAGYEPTGEYCQAPSVPAVQGTPSCANGNRLDSNGRCPDCSSLGTIYVLGAGRCYQRCPVVGKTACRATNDEYYCTSQVLVCNEAANYHQSCTVP